jgi:competence protein ComEC
MRITLIIIFVLWYSTLVGWDTPVIRSSIMWILWFLAIEYTRRVSSAAILLWIANIYLFISPLSLLYDPSFWLSFAATASIILLYTRTQQVFDTWWIPRWLWSILAITCVASIWTIPVTVYHFGSISYWFFFANIAIAIVVGWILFCTVFYGILWVFGESALYVFGLCIYIPVEYILGIARFFWAWWYWDISHDIRLSFIIIFLAFLCVQFFKIENLDALWVKKEHDHQR